MNWLKKIAKSTRKFHSEEARSIGQRIGINWASASFPLEEFRKGLEIEMEHGSHDPETDVIGGNVEACGKITWAHLKEMDNYYTKLISMEEDEGVIE
jgi:hypothetical protein